MAGLAVRCARLAGALVLLSAAALGCPTAAPIVKEQTFSASPGSLARVAVVPFYPRPELQASISEAGVSAEEVASTVTSFFANELSGSGVRVIHPSDLAGAFTSQGHAVPRRDQHAAAELAQREFGATAVVLGEVYRWRERTGEALGTDRPASVGFTVTLFDAPQARRLWTSRFDETQRPLSADVRNVSRYPGGGSRWVTAHEMARWGARHAAEAMVSGQWRDSN